ncbi:MAG TPA: TldD/PmbA family protein [Nitrososphaerales archaeon]|nr:TldD/PmbA family protein [Nitrososphaerales archaeon]
MLLETCSYAVKEALKQNADEAEAYALLGKESEVFLENNDLKQVKSHKTGGIGIRVFVKSSLGFASVNSLEREKVLDAVNKAIKIASVSPKDNHNGLPKKNSVHMLKRIYDSSAEGFEPVDATKCATEMLKTAKSYDSRVSVDSGTFNSSVLTHALCNSNNIELEEMISVFAWDIMGMALDGSDVSNFDFQFNATHSVKNIDVTATAEDFAKTVVNSLNARKIDSLKGSMLLSPNAAYELIQGVLTFAINSNNVQKKTSTFAKKVGKKVASNKLSVVDDATFTDGLSAESFDREGVGHRRNVIIDKGVLKRYIYNTYTADKDRTKSTGNAAGGTTSPPSVGPTNLIFEGGNKDLDHLIGEIKNGVMINRFSGNVNPVNGDFSGVVKGGHLIEKGNIVCPVKEVMVAGNVFDAVKNISGLSRERKKIFDSFLPYITIEGISFTAG